MSKLALCLWFDGRAEEAAAFYVATFRACGQPASLGRVMRQGEVGPGKLGSVIAVEFTLAGQPMMALNGGPQFSFSPAISLFVRCNDQAEVDRFWERLSEGGAPVQCGWLTDRFGVSWQIVPTMLLDLLHDSDVERRDRVMQAMMPMTKLDIAALQRAHEG
jgi:predicted 3-demethylubiquinone-9 3-methyltransferase (glyoxalase superfamily)